MKSLNPEVVVVMAGYCTQTAAESLKEDGSVDLVPGNQEKKDPVRILDAYLAEELEASFAAGDMYAATQYEDLAASRNEEYTRTFLKVQGGCNQYYPYCIIPFLHGNIRSRRPGDIRREAERLAAGRTRELALAGIHLSSYGRNFKNVAEREDLGDGVANLLELLTLLDDVEDIERLRIDSLGSKTATPDLAMGLASLRHFRPHFHLLLQSGNSATLRRTGRRYTAEGFGASVETLRAVFPDAAMATDMIAGFPGGSEKEFSEGFSFIGKMRFYETYISPYSKREGTRAATMPEQVPGTVKKRCAAFLQELSLRWQREFRTSRLGTAREMLSEGTVTIDGQAYPAGNSREHMKLAVPPSVLGGNCAVNCLYRGTAESLLNSEILLLMNVSKT